MPDIETSVVKPREFIRFCRVSRIIRQTEKAYLVAIHWFPKSQSMVRDNYLYVTEWILRKKGLRN